jgi:thioredoxin 1
MGLSAISGGLATRTLQESKLHRSPLNKRYCNFSAARGSVLAGMTMKKLIEVNQSNFETEVLQAKTPVVVDFYAEWCGPCKMLAPILEQLAGEFEGRIKFAKVNVDTAPELAGSCDVTAVPTLALFRDGQPVDAVVGALPPKALKAWLESAIPANASASLALQP